MSVVRLMGGLNNQMFQHAMAVTLVHRRDCKQECESLLAGIQPK
jgi:hypothetical protein